MLCSVDFDFPNVESDDFSLTVMLDRFVDTEKHLDIVKRTIKTPQAFPGNLVRGCHDDLSVIKSIVKALFQWLHHATLMRKHAFWWEVA